MPLKPAPLTENSDVKNICIKHKGHQSAHLFCFFTTYISEKRVVLPSQLKNKKVFEFEYTTKISGNREIVPW
jgi:hypothetical protein